MTTEKKLIKLLCEYILKLSEADRIRGGKEALVKDLKYAEAAVERDKEKAVFSEAKNKLDEIEILIKEL